MKDVISLFILFSSLFFSCGDEEMNEIQCGCDGPSVKSVDNADAYTLYDNPLGEPNAGLLILYVQEQNPLTGADQFRQYHPCDLSSEDRTNLSKDSLILKVSGVTKGLCPTIDFVGTPFELIEYEIIPQTP